MPKKTRYAVDLGPLAAWIFASILLLAAAPGFAGGMQLMGPPQPNQLWSVRVEARVVALASIGPHLGAITSNRELICVDPGSEQISWRTSLDAYPIDLVASGELFIVLTTKSLFGITPDSGVVVWRVERRAPALDANLLAASSDRVFAWLGEEGLTALDAKTGRGVWRRTRDSDWSAVALVAHDGMVVAVNQLTTVLDGRTGETLWRAPLKVDVANRLIVHRDELIVASGSVVDAYGLQSGRKQWRVDLGEEPEGIIPAGETIVAICPTAFKAFDASSGRQVRSQSASLSDGLGLRLASEIPGSPNSFVMTESYPSGYRLSLFDPKRMTIAESLLWQQKKGRGVTHHRFPTKPAFFREKAFLGSEDGLVSVDFGAKVIKSIFSSGGVASTQPCRLGDGVLVGTDEGQLVELDIAGARPIRHDQVTSGGLEELALTDGLVIARTKSGELLALEQKTRRQRWSLALIGEKTRVLTNRRVVLIADERGLSRLRKRDGKILWTWKDGSTRQAPIIADRAVYTLSTSSGICRLSLSSGRPVGCLKNLGTVDGFDATADLVVIRSGKSASVCTWRGKRQWTVKLEGEEVVQPTIADGKVLLATESGVWAFGARSGAELWRLQFGRPEVSCCDCPPCRTTRPRVEGDFVYLFSQGRLFEISSATGDASPVYSCTCAVPDTPPVEGGILAFQGGGSVDAVDYRRPPALRSWRPASGSIGSHIADGSDLYLSTGDGLIRFDLARWRPVWRSPQASGRFAPRLALAGDKLVTCSSGMVCAFEKQTGQKQWCRSVPGGFVGVPSAHGDSLVLPVLSSEGEGRVPTKASTVILALSVEDGSTLWKYPGIAHHIRKLEVVGKTIVAGPNETGHLVGIDVESGEERWRFVPVREAGNVSVKTDSVHAYFHAVVDGKPYFLALDVDSGRILWRMDRAGPSVGLFGDVLVSSDVGRSICVSKSSGSVIDCPDVVRLHRHCHQSKGFKVGGQVIRSCWPSTICGFDAETDAYLWRFPGELPFGPQPVSVEGDVVTVVGYHGVIGYRLSGLRRDYSKSLRMYDGPCIR